MAKTRPLTAEDVDEFKAKLLVRATRVQPAQCLQLVHIAKCLESLAPLRECAEAWTAEEGINLQP